ncbi:MAG: hypothetical protein M3Y41_17245 [Pseudomonadota bacterium]|nr:hypothetical protein [Pseudomonadota bacterium]
MRRTVAHLLAAFALLASLAHPAGAQAPVPAPTGAVPHAFLFGIWTGGLFPVPSAVSAQACLAQPSMIFTRDVVMRATLTDVLYIERLIETARGTGNGIDVHLVPATPQQAATLVAGGSTGLGFGCDSPNLLHIQRLTNNQITFPGCKDFPFPLVRCPAG